MDSRTYSFTPHSGNRKLRGAAVVSAPRRTCWRGCPLRKCCYGLWYPINIHWAQVSDGRRGMPWGSMLRCVAGQPLDAIWRYGDVGDLPGRYGRLDAVKVNQLASANGRRRGFLYSHYPVASGPHAVHNYRALQAATYAGLTCNASAEGLRLADVLYALGLPVVTVLPRALGDWRTLQTPRGVAVVRCPAEYREGLGCLTCGGKRGPLCARAYRPYIIGLTAHGTKARAVEAVVEATERKWANTVTTSGG